METDEISKHVVDAGYKVHKSLGPGLLESAYGACLCHEFSKRGLKFVKQKDVPIIYDGIKLASGFRIDIVVEDQIIIELKAVEEINNLHMAQLLTYLKLTGKRLGFIINFNTPFIKDGIKRTIL